MLNFHQAFWFLFLCFKIIMLVQFFKIKWDFVGNLVKFFMSVLIHVSGWCQKKHLRRFSRYPRTLLLKPLESKCLYISVVNIPYKEFLFQRCRKLLSGSRLNNFLQAACFEGLARCFIMFHFDWNSWKFKYFLAFWYSINSIKTLTFSRQFGLKG